MQAEWRVFDDAAELGFARLQLGGPRRHQCFRPLPLRHQPEQVEGQQQGEAGADYQDREVVVDRRTGLTPFPEQAGGQGQSD
jgi:hypothetical protein